MDESADNGAGERRSHEANAAKADRTPGSESSAASAEPSKAAAGESANTGRLPIVWSPKLDAGAPIGETHINGIAAAAAQSASSAGTAGEATRPRSFLLHPALLAASIACAVAVSAVAVPHLVQMSFEQINSAQMHLEQMHLAQIWSTAGAKSETIDLAALKASLDGATRDANAQIARLAERLDHVEHAQSEPAAKIAHLAEAIDRLEKKTAATTAAPETTGSIPAPPAEAKPSERVLHDWILRSLRGGRALVQSRYGGVFVVATGSVLPGLGRVEVVQRQDGQWVVATGRGVIAGR